MKKVIAALIGFAVIALPQSAIAVPVAHRDDLSNIIITDTGLAPGTFLKIYYPQIFDVKSFSTTGACKLLTIKESSTFNYYDTVKINGTQITLPHSDPPTLNGKPCVAGVPNTTYPWTVVGSYKYFKSWNVLYIIAPNAGQFSLVGDLPKLRLGKVDTCGRISIKNSAKWPMAALNFGNGTFDYISGDSYPVNVPLPTITTAAMPICRKGTLYRRLEP